MSTGKADDLANGEAGLEAGPLPDNSIGAIVSTIFNDVFQNLVHDIVLEAHREEKTLKMRSAVAIAEDAAATQQHALGNTPQKENPTPTSASAGVSGQFVGRVETAGAIYDSGHVTLKGNPLKTTKDVICPRCRLPQLQHPTSGKNARPLPDPSQKYCKMQPFVTKAGHDIWANPFPTDNAKNAKLKKEMKENAAAAAKQAEQASANGSIDTPAGSPRPSQDFKTIKVTSYPYVKCSNCNKHWLVNRFAKHFDGCMGITVRQSSRNAKIKISASSNTPSGSRTGTPAPGSKPSPNKRDTEDNDSDSSTSTVTPQKKKKKKPPIKPPPPTTSTSAIDAKRGLSKPKPSKLKDSNTVPNSSPSVPSPLKQDHSKDTSPSKVPKKAGDSSSATTAAGVSTGNHITLSTPNPPPRVLINKPLTQPTSNGLNPPKKLKRLGELSNPSTLGNSSTKREVSPNAPSSKSPGSGGSSKTGSASGSAQVATLKKRKREEGAGGDKSDRDKKQKSLNGSSGKVG